MVTINFKVHLSAYAFLQTDILHADILLIALLLPCCVGRPQPDGKTCTQGISNDAASLTVGLHFLTHKLSHFEHGFASKGGVPVFPPSVIVHLVIVLT